MSFFVAIFFIFHGLVHLLWFGVYWRFFTMDHMPYSSSVLMDKLYVGDVGVRIAGLLWVVATIMWVAAGLGLSFLAPWWAELTVAAALFSSVMCISGLPVAKYGLLINLAILIFLFMNGRF